MICNSSQKWHLLQKFLNWWRPGKSPLLLNKTVSAQSVPWSKGRRLPQPSDAVCNLLFSLLCPRGAVVLQEINRRSKIYWHFIFLHLHQCPSRLILSSVLSNHSSFHSLPDWKRIPWQTLRYNVGFEYMQLKYDAKILTQHTTPAGTGPGTKRTLTRFWSKNLNPCCIHRTQSTCIKELEICDWTT